MARRAGRAHPEEELRRLEALLRSRSVPRVVLLSGPGRWFRERAMEAVAAWGGAGADVSRLDGEEPGGAGALRDLRTGSLFARRRVLLVRQAGKWLKAVEAALLEALDLLPATSHLVLDVDALDGRTRLARALAAAGAAFQFRDLYERPYRAADDPASAELVRWVVERASGKGLSLPPATALLLVQTVGAEPGALDAELVRLARALEGTRGPVTPEAVRDLLHVGFSSTQFQLAEALLAGELSSALRCLDAFSREGLRDAAGRKLEASGLFPMVSSWLHRTFRSGLVARRLMDGGEAPFVAAARAGVHAFQDRFVAAVRRRERWWFEEAIVQLARCNVRVRTLGEDPVVLLERLVMELAGGRR